MLHNFENSLHHERDQAAKADAFYRDVLLVSKIKRFNTQSDADMEMQLQDVDVLLTINGVTYRVSEKFRDTDYGDLYVEMYSKYPSTAGWMHTGSPNAILYFTPKSVYWITHKSLSTFCLEVLFPLIPKIWCNQLFLSHKTIVSKRLALNGNTIKINLIQAHNHPTSGNNWETIGLSAPFTVFEKNGVKIKKFENNEQLKIN